MYAEAIPQMLDATLAREVLQKFEAFVSSSKVLKWFITSDFVVGDSTRPLDVFAFSIIPYDDTIENLLKEIDAASKHDIKKVKEVPSEMLSLLRETRRFHFVLIADRSRNWPGGVPQARDSMEQTLGIMQKWEDASEQAALIKAVKALRQEANAKNFNYRLFGDIVLLSVFTAYLAAMLVRNHSIEGILWAPDRDKMTTAYGRVAAGIFSMNFGSMCQRWSIDDARQARAKVGFAYEPDDAMPMWFDGLVRIPDFLAGTVAAWNVDDNLILADHPKFTQVLEQSIADNSNIEILRMFAPAGGGLSLARVVTTSAKGMGVSSV